MTDEHYELLSTTLAPPRLSPKLVLREALLARLDAGLGHKLTLISAPAGFGKTTLLAQWIAGSSLKKHEKQVAWVSLEAEVDHANFWRYIVTALNRLRPGIAASALALLDTTHPPLRAIPRILINEVSAIADDLFLVLDDYHRVDNPSVHRALTFFIDHLPPNLHLIVASRSRPELRLARWRVGNQLSELVEDDLRFSPEEVATFLNDSKGLELTPQDTLALGIRTEGWIAGLQLVALSLQGTDDTFKHRFVSAFTGSQRYIFDYLLEEVLQRQPGEIRDFLLQTSVLKRLTAPLCNAVTRQSNGQAMLEHLDRTNMFTVPLDQQQRWYRYHHLFRDVLRHRLQQTQPTAAHELHRRAAEWYIQRGQPEDAIGHAFAAKAWDLAVDLIEAAVSVAWNRGEVRKIVAWLDSLPQKRLDEHPYLSLYYSRALLHGGQMEAAEQRLRDAEGVLRARLADHSTAEARELLGTNSALRTTIAAVTGETARALNLGQEALTLLSAQNVDMRAYVTNSLGVTHYYQGNLNEAVQAFAERFLIAAIELGEQMRAFGSALWEPYYTLARIKLVHGDRAAALALVEQVQMHTRKHSVPVPTSLVRAEHARARLMLEQFDVAEHWARGLQLDSHSSPGIIQAFESLTMARLHLRRDEPERALSFLDWLRPMFASNEHKGHQIEILVLTALARKAEGDSSLSVRTLYDALVLAEPEGYLRVFVDEGRPMAALLYQTLALGVFPDYVSKLLANFPVHDTLATSDKDRPGPSELTQAEGYLFEPLSPRELEILQLIARGASNQDIADELVIAVSTVKKHVSNVIHKLGVDNRTQAAAKGHQLGLC